MRGLANCLEVSSKMSATRYSECTALSVRLCARTTFVRIRKGTTQLQSCCLLLSKVLVYERIDSYIVTQQHRRAKDGWSKNFIAFALAAFRRRVVNDFALKPPAVDSCPFLLNQSALAMFTISGTTQKGGLSRGLTPTQTRRLGRCPPATTAVETPLRFS